MDDKKSLSGILFWPSLAIGVIFTIISVVAKSNGDLLKSENTEVFARIFYALAGLFIIIWLIGKLFKADAKANKALEETIALKVQIDNLKNQKRPYE